MEERRNRSDGAGQGYSARRRTSAQSRANPAETRRWRGIRSLARASLRSFRRREHYMRFVRYFAAPALVLMLGSSIALADMVERTTEKTTTYKGVVSSVEPASSTIILRSDSATAPKSYTFNKE